MAFVGMLAISADSPLIRWAEADGWVVSFWYGVFTTPAMVGYLFLAERGSPIGALRRSGYLAWVSGTLQAMSTIAFALAVKATDIANVVVIVAATPIIAAVMAWLALGEKAERRTWTGALVVLLGILVVVRGSFVAGPFGFGAIEGDMLALAAVFAFSINLTIWRKHPEISRTLVIAISGGVAAAISVTQVQVLGQSTTTYVATAIMGVVFGPLGRISLASATRFVTAAEVGLVTPVETVAGSFWAWLFFAETPTEATVLGGVIILAGVLYGTVFAHRSAGLAKPPTVTVS